MYVVKLLVFYAWIGNLEKEIMNNKQIESVFEIREKEMVNFYIRPKTKNSLKIYLDERD